MASSEYESILCVKPQVHVFKIPPRPSNRGYRAADWKLDHPDWTGRLRVVAKGSDLSIKLEDKTSGDLFARCPVEQYPGIAVESVTDSSRYFVLRIKDDNGRSAFIGIGFEDRGDSFDLNVALQDHFKHLKVEKDAEQSVAELQKGPKLDLGFKEGQTIRINIASGNKSTDSNTTPKRVKPKAAGGIGFLPPPPGGVKILPPEGATIPSQPAQQQQQTTNSNSNSNVDLLLDFGADTTSSSANVGQGQINSSADVGQGQASQGSSLLDFDPGFDLLSNSDQPPVQPMGGSADPWGEFASANSSSDADADWVQF